MIESTAERAPITAHQDHTDGDVADNLNRASSLSAAARAIGSEIPLVHNNNQPLPSEALRRCKSLPPGFSPTTLELTQTRPIRSSSTLIQHFYRFLRNPVLLKLPLVYSSGQTELTRLPRASRLEELQKNLAKTSPRTDVVYNLIAFYGYIPCQQRPQAREAIMKWMGQLPASQATVLSQVTAHLDQVDIDLEFVDEFHDGDTGIAQVMNGAPEDQSRELQEKCYAIYDLPQEHRWDAFTAIFENTQNPDVLQTLATVISDLTEQDQSAAWRALLGKTQHQNVLDAWADVIQNLPKADVRVGWNILFNKTENPEDLLLLAWAIRCLPEEDKSARWTTLLNKTPDHKVLEELAEVFDCLPKEDKGTAWQALLNKTNNPRVLQELVWQIICLSEADRSAGWHAILDKPMNQQIFWDLADSIRNVREEDRSAALHALLKKTRNRQVLEKLEQVAHFLPDSDKPAAMRAIHKAQIRASRV